jgi:hypothetical protein
MKKIITYFLILNLMMMNLVFAIENRPCLYTSSDGKSSFIKVCNNVQDIVCKDVQLSERKSCNENEQDLFRNNMTTAEVMKIISGCFGEAGSSFKKFFTDFLPDLLKAIWDITKGTVSSIANSATGDGPSLWDKLKGSYESVRSVAADVYEAASENPAAFMQKMWSKITGAIGSMITNYDCLKPELKVSKVCGFVAEWVIPPLMLAKILVKGVKVLKATAAAYGFANDQKKIIRFFKAFEKGDLATVAAMKFEGIYKTLGYTKEEFDYIIKGTGILLYKIEELKNVSTPEGKKQRHLLLLSMIKEPKPIPTAVAKAAVLAKAASVATAKIPEFLQKSDFFTVRIVRGNGEVAQIPAEVMERIMVDGKEVALRVRVYDPATGMMKEAKINVENLAGLSPQPATANVSSLMAEGRKTNPQFKSVEEEFGNMQDQFKQVEAAKKAAEQEKNARAIKNNMPDGMSVEELAIDDPRVIEAFQAKKKVDPNGIDFVFDPNARNMPIKKSPEPKVKKGPKEKTEGQIVGYLNSNFVSLQMKNSMGITTKMSAQIVRKFNDSGVEKFVVQVWDQASQSLTEKIMTVNELKMAHASGDTAAEAAINKAKKSVIPPSEPNL